jgi:hypothetical protein
MLYPAGMTNPIEKLCTDWGMSLSDISTVSKTPTAKLRTWRRGDDSQITEAQQIAVDQLLRFLSDCKEAGAEDPASWMERRLVTGYTVRGLDLYLENERITLMEIMKGTDAVPLLDWAIRDWRTRFDTRFEVFEAEDGYPSLRMK